MVTINQFCKKNNIDARKFKSFLLKPHYNENADKKWSVWKRFLPFHKNATLVEVLRLYVNYDCRKSVFSLREIDLLLS